MNLRPIFEFEHSFQRYLAAKHTVDDRALNGHVWRSLALALPTPIRLGRPLRVLEVGAGIGTMVERFLTWLPPRDIAYTALDAMPENTAAAADRLPAWAAANGFTVAQAAESLTLARLRLPCRDKPGDGGFVRLCRGEAGRQAWDLLIAHAVLDLLDVPAALPWLFSPLAPGGLFYFTIVFDGATLLEPAIDPALDAHVEALYHRTMDERITAGVPSGDSRAAATCSANWQPRAQSCWLRACPIGSCIRSQAAIRPTRPTSCTSSSRPWRRRWQDIRRWTQRALRTGSPAPRADRGGRADLHRTSTRFCRPAARPGRVRPHRSPQQPVTTNIDTEGALPILRF